MVRITGERSLTPGPEWVPSMSRPALGMAPATRDYRLSTPVSRRC